MCSSYLFLPHSDVVFADELHAGNNSLPSNKSSGDALNTESKLKAGKQKTSDTVVLKPEKVLAEKKVVNTAVASTTKMTSAVNVKPTAALLEKNSSAIFKSGAAAAKPVKVNAKLGSASEKTTAVNAKLGSAFEKPTAIDAKVGAATEKTAVLNAKSGSAPASVKEKSAPVNVKAGASSETVSVKTGNSNEKTPVIKAHRKNSSSAKSMLVPPPPPSVPTMTEMGMQGMGTQMVFMGENVEFLPFADLKDLKTKTDIELTRQRRLVEEFSSASHDAKQKADSFDQLFAEGVISRRELETSKKDNDKSIQDLTDAKQILSALEQKFVRIERRLEELNKAKISSSASNKKPHHHH